MVECTSYMVLDISRPRFWMYLLGPYLLGSFAAQSFYGPASLLSRADFYYLLLFFLFPANVILYGINDLYDVDTDSKNSKKSGYEFKVSEQNKLYYFIFIAVATVFALPLIFFLKLIPLNVFYVFLFFVIFYSCPPLRFKARPFFDSASNILYAIPGFIAFFQFSSDELLMLDHRFLLVLLASFCWCAAMHLFSAIPDIKPDSKAKLNTSAIMLGEKKSLVACTLLWGVAAVLSVFVFPLSISLFAYPAIPILVLKKKIELLKMYKLFPIVNIALLSPIALAILITQIF